MNEPPPNTFIVATILPKPARKQNPPPTTRPLIAKPPVYRRKFKLPEGGGRRCR